MQERLERFLSWLLDARWFPETKSGEKKRLRSELRKVRRVLARMKAFSKGIPNVRLERGLAEWESYERSIAASLKQQVRGAPHIRISSLRKGSREIAERLMCAVLIIRKLRPHVSAYEEVQRLLADPALLPFPITVSEERIRELRTGTISRPVTASEMNYLEESRDIPMRRYSISVKAIQTSVARLKQEIEAGQWFNYSEILQNLYAEYLWSQQRQAGFSEAEAAMLRTLVASDGARRGRSSRATESGEPSGPRPSHD